MLTNIFPYLVVHGIHSKVRFEKFLSFHVKIDDLVHTALFRYRISFELYTCILKSTKEHSSSLTTLCQFQPKNVGSDEMAIMFFR